MIFRSMSGVILRMLPLTTATMLQVLLTGIVVVVTMCRVCCWFLSLALKFSGFSSLPPCSKINISKFQFDLRKKILDRVDLLHLLLHYRANILAIFILKYFTNPLFFSWTRFYLGCHSGRQLTLQPQLVSHHSLLGLWSSCQCIETRHIIIVFCFV